MRFAGRPTTLHRLIFFAIPFVSGIAYLLAFYPGISTYDSIFQWDQVARFDFNNWHPAYHTILTWLMTRVWYAPAVMALLQITVFGLVMAYGLATFQDLDVPFLLLVLLDGFISLLPMNGILMVTYWKDVLYGLSVLLLTIYLLKIIVTGGEWLDMRGNWVWLGIVSANVALLRANGQPVALGTLLLILVCFAHRRNTLLALGLASLMAILISGPVYQIFKVNRANTQPAGVVFIHPIVAHVQAGSSLAAPDTAYLDRIRPLASGWPYSCYDATVLFYQGVQFQPVQDDPLYAAGLLGRLTRQAPLVTLRHFYCLSSFVWKLAQPDGVPLETVYVENQDLSVNPDWQVYAAAVDQQPRLPGLKMAIVRLIDRWQQVDPGQVAWRPAIYLYLFVVAVLLGAVTRKHKPLLLLLVPALIQTAVIALTAHHQALRYQYPVYLVSTLFTLPMLYLTFFGVTVWRGRETIRLDNHARERSFQDIKETDS